MFLGYKNIHVNGTRELLTAALLTLLGRLLFLMNETGRGEWGSSPSPPSARHLDDGIQGDIPIEDLMKGLKGFL